EGCFARAALASDVELFDDTPSHYTVYAMRRHRWTRGDWQIAPWLFPYVPAEGGRRVRNVLELLDRWRIFDNLRRSLLPVALLVLLIGGWSVLPGSALFWTLAVVVILAFPVYAHLTTSALNLDGRVRWTSYFWSVWTDITTNTAQAALAFL